jgi:PleD family two-component response regulator
MLQNVSMISDDRLDYHPQKQQKDLDCLINLAPVILTREDTKILLVDDNSSDIGLYKLFLNFWGYSIIEEADNGELALKRYRKFSPHLVLTDTNLPTMSGIEVCKQRG